MGKPVVHWEFWTENPSLSDHDGRVLGIWKQDARGN